MQFYRRKSESCRFLKMANPVLLTIQKFLFVDRAFPSPTCRSVTKSICNYVEGTPDQAELEALGFFYLKLYAFWLVYNKQSLKLRICLFYTFYSKCICIANKKVFRKKGYKMMFIRTNCDRKSQFSGILTEPLILRAGSLALQS